LAKDKDAIQKLTESLIPSIYGHDKIKEGILIQLVGGVRKKIDDGTVKRGDIHILMIGDPGSGKSAMLQRIEKVVPHASTSSGNGYHAGKRFLCQKYPISLLNWAGETSST
jgi:DNA replicative helicase MCM subunit Mcm2 (Cdc46/Mcm family)